MNFRFLSVLLLASCASLPDTSGPYAERDLRAFSQAPVGSVLVDLRTAGEVGSGTLPGAIWVDFWSPAFGTFLETADKSKPYLVFCAHGVRGREAVVRMRASGFVEVHNLAGGLVGGKESP